MNLLQLCQMLDLIQNALFRGAIDFGQVDIFQRSHVSLVSRIHALVHLAEAALAQFLVDFIALSVHFD